MAKRVAIYIRFDHNGWWVVSESSNEFEDFVTVDEAEVQPMVDMGEAFRACGRRSEVSLSAKLAIREGMRGTVGYRLRRRLSPVMRLSRRRRGYRQPTALALPARELCL